MDWQIQQRASLPDISFVGVVLTMPDALWPFFKANRRMWHDIPAVGASAIAAWAWSKYRVKLSIIVVPHTFGGFLNFNPHLHVMVSAGGLNPSPVAWREAIDFSRAEIMEAWRYAVTDYLRAAIGRGLRCTSDSREVSERIVQHQARRLWNVKITQAMSKWQFLRYAGRYIRRLPISQRRIHSVSKDEVVFQSKDTRASKRAASAVWVERRCTPVEFIDLLSQHLPDRYRHSMRYFGLLAPRVRSHSTAFVRLVLNQPEQRTSQRRPFAALIRKQFGYDPLRDSKGNRMRWIRSIPPQVGVSIQTIV